MRLLFCFATVCTITLLTACGPRPVYERQVDFPESAWAYPDTVAFAYPIADTTARYDLVLDLRHATDFPYQNFYVRLFTELPDGRRLTQPLSLQLANNFGEWLGDCDAETCLLQVALQEGTAYPEVGTYGLTVEQYSRDSVLRGIEGVGFRLMAGE